MWSINFDKSFKVLSVETINGVNITVFSYKRMNLCLCLISYVNTNLKCIMDLNVKAREIMLDNVKREIMLKAWAEQRLLRT